MDSHDRDHFESREIPLLEDIVKPDELAVGSDSFGLEASTPAAPSPDTTPPALDDSLLVSREAIAEQLLDELKPIVTNAVESAITETVKRIDEMLHDELDSPLEHRIRCLIEEQLDKKFGHRSS